MISNFKEQYFNGIFKREDGASFLFSFAIALGIFGFLSGNIRLWDTGGFFISPAFRASGALAAVLVLISFVWSRVSKVNLKVQASGFAFALILSFFFDWLCRDYSLLQGPSIRGIIILLTIFSYLFLREKTFSFLNVCGLIAPFILLWAFLSSAHGRLLFSDDHPSMLFRLQMLKEHFPFIPFYNPTWNAGFDNRDFFATGILNVFLIFSPIIYFFNLLSKYNLIIGLFLFVLVPFVSYGAAKIEGLKSPAPALCAILALCSSLLWYRWGLKYGAIGFVASASLLPLNFVLLSKILSIDQELSKFQALLFVISMSLMSFWSLSGLILVPVLVGGLLLIRRVLRKRYIKKIVVTLVIVNAPWMFLFLSVSSVSTFLVLKNPIAANRDAGLNKQEKEAGQKFITTSEKLAHRVVKGGVKPVSLTHVIKSLREFATKVHPLILFLAIPGIFLFERRSTRVLFAVLGLWLLFLGTVGASLKPQLELDRMLVILVLLSSLPASQAMSSLLNFSPQKYFLSSVLCGYLFAGLFSVSAIASNRSLEQFSFADDLVNELSATIRQNGGDGRTVFAGFILHELSAGHIAPLALLSGKPLVASSPFHNVWWYTDIMPPSFKSRGRDGMEEFFDLQNATAVVAHERKWRLYFERFPEKYKLIWRKSGFGLWKRDYKSNYFLKGDGEILEQTSSFVRLKLRSDSAVIKFNYFPFLESSACEIRPEEVANEYRFIKIVGCAPGTEVLIRAKTGYKRLLK